MRFSAGSLFTLLSASTLAAGGASAQSADDAVLEEVIVTAQKRAEPLMDVPISVAAFSQKKLADSNISDLLDIVGFAPGVEVTPSQNGGGTFNIRGVSTGIEGPGVDPNIALYWNGVYVPRSVVAFQDFIDVERVEILRGPQGTLYGRNATGGAINVISKKPSDEFETNARLDYGRFDKFGAAAAVSVPFSDKVALRLSASRQTQDNYAINLENNERLKNIDSRAGTVALQIRPTDSLEILLRADAEEDDGLGVVAQHAETNGTDTTGADLPRNPYEFRNDFVQNANFLRNRGASAEITWTVNDYVVKSISGGRKIETNLLWDQDGTEVPSAFFRQLDNSRSWSQELQLVSPKIGRFDWIGGLYYFNEDVSVLTSNGGPAVLIAETGLRDLTNAPFPTITQEVPFSNRGFYNAFNDTDAYAAFGELRFDWTDRVRTTLGLRYSREKKVFNGANRRVYSATDGSIQDTPFDVVAACTALVNQGYRATYVPGASAERSIQECASATPVTAYQSLQSLIDYYSTFDSGLVTRPQQTIDEDTLTPRVVFEFRPRAGLMLYASATRGFKSGGFNTYDTNPISVDVDGDGVVGPEDFGVIPYQDPFDSESLWAYEAGLKGDWFERKLQLSTAVFYYDYQNIQAQVYNNADRTTFVTNGAQARIDGVELDATLTPWRETQIDFSAAWIETKFTEFGFPITDSVTDQDNVDFTGREVPGTPKLKWNLGAQQTFYLADNRWGGITLRGEWLHRSDSPYLLTLTDETDGGDYDLFNLRATWRSPTDRISLTTYVENATDQDYDYYVSSGTLFGKRRLLGPPRTYGVSVQVKL